MGKKEKLTQAQKAYLVKRIDEVTHQKIYEISGRNNTYPNQHYNGTVLNTVSDKAINKSSVEAIISGKIRLLSRKDVKAHLKQGLASNPHGSFNGTHALDFIDVDSLIAFNRARNVEAKKGIEKQNIRINKVKEAASDLKDEVMLEGNLAIGMLEKFEKKKF